MTIECYCKGMSRGTTPSFSFHLSIPILGRETYYMTFRQHGQIILEKEDNQIIRVDKDTIKIKLKQEETLLFSSKFPIEVQIRTKYADGAAVVSNIMEFWLDDIIKDGVI